MELLASLKKESAAWSSGGVADLHDLALGQQKLEDAPLRNGNNELLIFGIKRFLVLGMIEIITNTYPARGGYYVVQPMLLEERYTRELQRHNF